MTSYHSQIGQDIWVAERVFPQRRRGFFVDVGAYDGVRYSNTAALERDLGWDGVAIEAEPGAAAALASFRRCRTVCALLDREERDRFFDGARGMLSAAVAPGAPAPPGAMRIRARTLLSILEEAKAPPEIDYLTVDVEGGEADVLAAFPFQRRFGALTIEVHAHRPEAGALLGQLRAAGYVRTGCLFSDWFLRPAQAGVAENGDQRWLEDELLRRLNPAYRDKPEVAHVPWVREWKRKREP